MIHLAWLIQPSRDGAELEKGEREGLAPCLRGRRPGRRGSARACSSVGVYSPGPKDRAVDESWPREGVASSFYSRDKAAAERELDQVEAAAPEMRVVRLRPGLIFKREAGPEVRRLFGGPFVPATLLAPGRLPVLPLPDRLVLQAAHGEDVGEAYRLAALSPDARGAYNIAHPILDPAALARTLRARRVSVPGRALRTAADLAWRARLQPSPAGWVDMGLAAPVMDTSRAREQLRMDAPPYGDGSAPRASGRDALGRRTRQHRHSGHAPAGRCGSAS